MFSRVDAFVRDVRELKTEDQLAEALGDVSNDLGFRFFALTLGHAPPPLTANGLDMRDGHPAKKEDTEDSQARFSRLGAHSAQRQITGFSSLYKGGKVPAVWCPFLCWGLM